MRILAYFWTINELYGQNDHSIPKPLLCLKEVRVKYNGSNDCFETKVCCREFTQEFANSKVIGDIWTTF